MTVFAAFVMTFEEHAVIVSFNIEIRPRITSKLHSLRASPSHGKTTWGGSLCACLAFVSAGFSGNCTFDSS